MTPGERKELRVLLKNTARLETMKIDARAKSVEADFERQLATQYERKHEAWADLTAAATAAVQAADRELAARCQRLGIPQEFRPQLHLSWYARGENAVAQRRTELRRVALTEIQALARAAKAALERQVLELDTQLVAGALDSADAHAFLARIPHVEALMPSLDLKQLEAYR